MLSKLFLAMLLWGQVAAVPQSFVQTSGRNLPAAGLETTVSGQCKTMPIAVTVPIDANSLSIKLAGQTHTIETGAFDLAKGGKRYPARILPRCKFDDSGVEILILFSSRMDAGGWSRQAFELDWSGHVTRIQDERSVSVEELSNWFE